MGDPSTESSVQPVEGNFEDSRLYRDIYAYVEKFMSHYDPSHDFHHILRVLNLAKHILAQETRADPSKDFDRQAVVLAALLHDVGDKKYLQPGQNAEQMIRDLLRESDCPVHLADKVPLIVEHVSYSSEVKRPQLVQEVLAAHPELGIVQDADRLDAIGAVGIARTFSYSAAKTPDKGMQASIDHFGEKLEKLEEMMKTATGKQLARRRTERLKEFKSWWHEEHLLSA